MSKPRDTFIGNLKVLETKKIFAGKPLEAGRILVKVRDTTGFPFWCEMAEEDYAKAIENGKGVPVEVRQVVKLLRKA